VCEKKVGYSGITTVEGLRKKLSKVWGGVLASVN